jgi:hypothetical protein
LIGNPQKPPEPIFFLDRTHGKKTHKLLECVDIKVVHHNDFYLQETPDTEWIRRCGREGWIILTGDKEIERVPENRQAVIDAKCKVFFFNDTNSRGEEWAAAVIVGRKRLYEMIEKNNGPFFVTIQKDSRSHLSQIRFAGEGGPKPVQVLVAVVAEASRARPEPSLPTPERKPQQGTFQFSAP